MDSWYKITENNAYSQGTPVFYHGGSGAIYVSLQKRKGLFQVKGFLENTNTLLFENTPRQPSHRQIWRGTHGGLGCFSVKKKV